MNSLEETVRLEKHTQEVLLQLDEMLILMLNAETGARGFLSSQDETFLEPYYQTQQNVKADFEKLRDLTSDNPIQGEKISRLENIIEERLSYLERIISVRRVKSLDETRAQFSDGTGKHYRTIFAKLSAK